MTTKNKPQPAAKPEQDCVHVPESRGFDGLSLYEDGMRGLNPNPAAYEYVIPAHTVCKDKEQPAKAGKKAPAKKPFKKAAAKKPCAKKPEQAKPEQDCVTIPAHRAFDGISLYEDGMSGKLRNVSEAYIEAVYSYEVPARTVCKDKVPAAPAKKKSAPRR